jgi:hypothetical protein
MELRAGSERPAADLGPGLGGSARDCSETSWKRLPMDSVDVKRAEATDLQTGDLDDSRPALVDPFGREISYLRVSVTISAVSIAWRNICRSCPKPIC